MLAHVDDGDLHTAPPVLVLVLEVRTHRLMNTASAAGLLVELTDIDCVEVTI
ncbi:hypothetical protein ACWDZ4_13520 [Streptomyces sp. NPDC003016]